MNHRFSHKVITKHVYNGEYVVLSISMNRHGTRVLYANNST